jgi:flagellar motor switch protein FliN/FliY
MKRESLKHVKVPTEVVLGHRDLTVAELASIGEGTIIELDNLAGEPVDLVAAGRVIAKAEVVVIDESFGVRVTQLVGEDGDDE